MSEYEYSGPLVPRTPEHEQLLRQRFDCEVEAIAISRLEDARKAWAESDVGEFPDLEQIRREARVELGILCRALDGWDAVDPDTILGSDRTTFGFLFE